MPIKDYSLNQTARNVKHWGLWEAAREVVANAMDADKQYTIEFPDGNTMRVITRTSMSLGQALVFGEGTKTQDDESIGQFGEGLKLAACICTRIEGAEMLIEFEGGSMSFWFDWDQDLACDILMAKVDTDNRQAQGCTVTIKGWDLREKIQGKFLDDGEQERIVPTESTPFLFGAGHAFAQGIYVCRLDGNWMHNYNFASGLIRNRDRNVLSHEVASPRIGKLMIRSMNDELADTLLERQMELGEVNSLTRVGAYDSDISGEQRTAAKGCFGRAFRRKYKNALVASKDGKVNSRAREMGNQVVEIHDGIRHWLPDDIETADKALPATYKYVITKCPVPDDAKHLCALVDQPIKVVIFKVREEYNSEYDAGRRMTLRDPEGWKLWINEKHLLDPAKFLEEIVRALQDVDDRIVASICRAYLNLKEMCPDGEPDSDAETTEPPAAPENNG